MALSLKASRCAAVSRAPCQPLLVPCLPTTVFTPAVSIPQQRASVAPVARRARQVQVHAKKASGPAEAVDFDVSQMELEENAEERMQKCASVVADNFNTIRTGRANPAILDRIQVDYYGALTPLKQLAGISTPDASTLLISPFDKGAIKGIEKAINESDVGINPNNDGERIRLIIPALTQERRKELTKQVSKLGEEGKVAVRNVRKDVLKKAGQIEFPKDQKKAVEDSIQKITDGFVKKIDDLVKLKSDELMKV